MKKDIEVLEVKGFSEPDTSLLILDEELKNKRKIKKIRTFIIVLVVVILLILLLLYGPLKKYFIEKAINNEFVQITTLLYGSEAINDAIAKNYVKEPMENTNSQKITFINENTNNQYEKEILDSDSDYKVIEINERHLDGYLIVIYDSSKISLETDYSKILNSKVSINAGSVFNDSVQGIVIKDGQLLVDNAKANVAGGIIGFNKENKLILGKYTSKEALELGIQNAIEYGPFLIVNGQAATIVGNGGWSKDNRSAIAQRQDGIVLFLYLKNTTISEVLTVLQNYGAINAANLPGGNNSMLIENGKILSSKKTNSPSAFVLNS